MRLKLSSGPLSKLSARQIVVKNKNIRYRLPLFNKEMIGDGAIQTVFEFHRAFTAHN